LPGHALPFGPACLQALAALRTIVSMSDQRRRFDDQHYVFFVTFSVYKRRRLLDLDQPKRIVLGVRKLRERLDDMHRNPVRAGLVKQADHWRWSSARWYLRRQTVGVPIRWVE
jgi:hypothetical protein